jgi:hypothetical protein
VIRAKGPTTIVAEYRTVVPPKKVLRANLRELYTLAVAENDANEEENEDKP